MRTHSAWPAIVSDFVHRGLRISYREYGAGPQALILIHGLLMDGSMFVKVAPALAARGQRVITVDLPGHGASDQPPDMSLYSMQGFGGDVVALIDHLGLSSAVVGGTSLGANVGLEVAVAAPEKVRGLVLEMPVLEKGIAAAAAVFVPMALALRLSQRGMRVVSALARRIPRTFFLADLFIDFARRDPASSLAVLDGIIFGRVAPPIDERRRIAQPTLVIGHPSDPIHPFSDADRTARELPHARMVEASSISEWRVRPDRLNAELAAFLDEVWRMPGAAGTA
ncbi:MAG TPA: alpha/beta hydrolase [Myxococcales bacterium]|nr:alpha/beta hydrolase [Myxococcales bacterium]